MGPQQNIAHYRITTKLGEGGMGEVWRATDTKLGRDVAIKILPEVFAQDPDRMARFSREAQVLASLNHPNIAQIYGVEERALVMELVEGETLSGPLPLDTALNYARQIADALEAAHEKGIVHRDLKPGNIKVTPAGAIKVLDFGLAAVVQSQTSGGGDSNASPTLTMRANSAGMIMGTAAYMSPEQARGKPVDRRADIWAFGVVLYEMLTGRQLFGGETVSDSLAAVLTREPDLALLPKDTPPHIRRLLERCLRKDPKTRLRDIGEARICIDEPAALQETAATIPARPRKWVLWAVAAVLIVPLVAILGISWLLVKPPAIATARFLLQLPEGTDVPRFLNATQAVPSPDGRDLAFIARDAKTGRSHLWVRPLASVSPRRLDGTEGANYPFWSPDGQFVGFFADNGVKKVAVSGGSVQTLCDMSAVGVSPFGGDGGTWNKNGVIVFSSGVREKGLMRVQPAGGQPTPVTTVDTTRGEISHSWPQFLPDGRHLLYFARSLDADKSGTYVQELGSSGRTLVMRNAAHGAYAPPGYLLFPREATLFAQPFNLRTFQLQGEPVPVAQEVSENAGNGRAAFAVSENGVLIYHVGSGSVGGVTQLTWHDRKGTRLNTVGDPGEYQFFSLSPDEKRAVVARTTGALRNADAWIMDLGSGILTRATFDASISLLVAPVWSPDSQKIIVNREREGPLEIVLASGLKTPLSKDPDAVFAHDWSPDGSFVVCTNGAVAKVSMVRLSAVGDRKPQPLLETPFPKTAFRISPDGRWIAYSSAESGNYEVYVAAFPSFGDKRQVSKGAVGSPFWRKDGKELFFLGAEGMLMAAEITGGPKIDVGVPKPLFKMNMTLREGEFAVSGDGQRVLVNERRQAINNAELMVVLNWMAELKH